MFSRSMGGALTWKNPPSYFISSIFTCTSHQPFLLKVDQLFKIPLTRSSPSADILLLLWFLGISIFGGGSGEKQITKTVRLSQVLRWRASVTRAFEHLSGSLCITSSFLTMVTAHWLLITSHRPSQASIRNSSSSVRLISSNSGSELKGLLEPLGPLTCQSPRARATDNWPLRQPSYMIPPNLSILVLSEVQLGLWSFDSSIALPRLPNTALESPALATSMVLQECSVTHKLLTVYQ